MTSAQIDRILAEDRPVVAVLLRSRRWLVSTNVQLARAWEDDDIWRVDMQDGEKETWHTFYSHAEEIVGISLDRTGSHEH